MLAFKEDGLYPHQITVVSDAWVSWGCTLLQFCTLVWFTRHYVIPIIRLCLT